MGIPSNIKRYISNILGQPVADQAGMLALRNLPYGARVRWGGSEYKLINPAAPSSAASWQVVPTILSAVLQADFPKTNDALANVTGLTLTLEAGKWYRVTGQFVWDADDSVGAKFDFAGGSATATGLQGTSYAAENGSSSGIGFLIDALTSGTAINSFPAGAMFSFTIQVNVGGTLIPRFAQQTTDAAASNLLKYSTIQAIEVTPA